MYTKAQQEAIDSNKKNIYVSASAGSGKTTVMIERVLRLLKSGVDLSEMIICTFTKASAQDMRTKLLKKLAIERDKGEAYAIKAIEKLPQAEISTIHSWCNKMIKTYFYMSDIAPTFELMDESNSQVLLNSAINEVIESYVNSDSDEFRDIYGSLLENRGDDKIRKVVRTLYEYACIRPSSMEWLKSLTKFEVGHQEHLDAIVKHYDNVLVDIMTKATNLRDESANISFSSGVKSIEKFMEEASRYEPLSRLSCKKDSDREIYIHTRYKGLRDYYGDCQKERADALVNSVDPKLTKQNMKMLVEIVEKVQERYAGKKNKKGYVDFADLEHCAYKILSSEQASELLSTRYKYLFVDEYQDINPLQDAIFSLLNLNRFYVGDIKQSIYSFRLCTPEIFAGKIESGKAEEDTDVIILDANFRADYKILSFCDGEFSKIMTKNFGGVDYAKDGKFKAGRAELYKDSVVCKVCLFDQEKEEGERVGGVYSVRDHANANTLTSADIESNMVVDHILNIVGTDLTENGVTRKVEYSDIAILLGSVKDEFSKTLVKKLAQANIPVAVKTETAITENMAVSLLINYLQLISNENNDIALASVLKSALGGFLTEAELMEIRQKTDELKCGSKSFVIATKTYANNFDTELSTKIKMLYERLSRFRQMSYVMPVNELAGMICAEYDYFKYAITFPNGINASKELAEFLSCLAGLSNSKSLHLALADISTLDTKLSVATVSDGVKLSTIHGSKGLEYPFVILTNLAKTFKFDKASGDCILNEDFGVGLKYFNKAKGIKEKTSLYCRLSLIEKKKIREERMRLLYVALTRSMYQTAIFSSKSKIKDKFITQASSFYDWLQDKLESVSSVHNTLEFSESVGMLTPTTTITGRSNKELVKEIKKHTEFKYNHTGSAVKISATRLAKLDLDSQDKTTYAEFSVEKDSRATDIGNAYHKFLEIVNYDNDFESEYKSFVAKYPIASGLVKKQNTLMAYNSIKKKIGGCKNYRELPFVCNHSSGVLLQGVIDLLIVRGDKAEIVDYKAGLPSKDMLEIYKKQLSAYQEAVKNILNIDDIKVSLFAISKAEFIDI